jgi:hypothetical protein
MDLVRVDDSVAVYPGAETVQRTMLERETVDDAEAPATDRNARTWKGEEELIGAVLGPRAESRERVNGWWQLKAALFRVSPRFSSPTEQSWYALPLYLA